VEEKLGGSAPINVTTLKSFLGIVIYYMKLLLTKLAPLQWSNVCKTGPVSFKVKLHHSEVICYQLRIFY